MLISLDRASAVSIQEQLFEQISGQIIAQRLKPGSPVLSSRNLATELGVSRNSVIFAYERLINEGFLFTRPTIGTFVTLNLPADMSRGKEKDALPAGQPPANLGPPIFAGRQHAILNEGRLPIDFWTQRTDPRAFPLKTWRRLILQSLATAAHNLTEYGDPCGLMSLRQAIAAHVAETRGIQASPEQIIIFAGAQLALNLVVRLLDGGGRLRRRRKPVQPGRGLSVRELQEEAPADRYRRRGDRCRTADRAARQARLSDPIPSVSDGTDAIAATPHRHPRLGRAHRRLCDRGRLRLRISLRRSTPERHARTGPGQRHLSGDLFEIAGGGAAHRICDFPRASGRGRRHR